MSEKKLFGNQDKKQEYSLSELLPFDELPEDKVIVVFPRFVDLPSGGKIEDVKSRTAQVYDEVAFAGYTKPDKQTNLSAFDLLYPVDKPVIVHRPLTAKEKQAIAEADAKAAEAEAKAKSKAEAEAAKKAEKEAEAERKKQEAEAKAKAEAEAAA